MVAVRPVAAGRALSKRTFADLSERPVSVPYEAYVLSSQPNAGGAFVLCASAFEKIARVMTLPEQFAALKLVARLVRCTKPLRIIY
jgi:hypothetical protein